MARSGAPKIQRHATSSTVSKGRVKTQLICPTTDWVPRKRSVLMSFDDKIHRLAGHDDHLGQRLPRDPSLNFIVRKGGGFHDTGRGTGRHTDHGCQLAVDLYGNLDLVFAGEIG